MNYLHLFPINRSDGMNRSQYMMVVKGLMVILTLVLLAFLFESLQLKQWMNTAWIDIEIRGQGWRGELFYLGIAIFSTAIGIPRHAVSFFAGYAFGLAYGLFLASIGTVGGCVVSFFYARFLGRDLIPPNLSNRIKQSDNFLLDHTFKATLFIRLLPAGNNLVTNLAAGVSGVRPGAFFLGSAIGYLPQTAIFVLIGSGVDLDPFFRIGLGTILFVISGVIGHQIYRSIRNGNRRPVLDSI